MTILALDLASELGWAVVGSPFPPSPLPLEIAAGATPVERPSGFHRLDGDDAAMKWLNYESWLTSHSAEWNVKVICYESPVSFRGLTAVRLLIGMAAITEMHARSRGIPCYEANPTDVKKHATGRGNAKKPEMIEAASQRGWNTNNDNEADALMLLDYMVEWFRGRGMIGMIDEYKATG